MTSLPVFSFLFSDWFSDRETPGKTSLFYRLCVSALCRALVDSICRLSNRLLSVSIHSIYLADSNGGRGTRRSRNYGVVLFSCFSRLLLFVSRANIDRTYTCVVKCRALSLTRNWHRAFAVNRWALHTRIVTRSRLCLRKTRAKKCCVLSQLYDAMSCGIPDCVRRGILRIGI